MHFALQSLLALFGKATYSSVCSCDDLIRMASIKISRSYLLQRSYTPHHTRVIQTIHHTIGAASVIFIWETNTKTWLRPKLGIESSNWRMYNSLLFLRYKMIMN